MTPEHFDVILIGAGLSGIGTGCHLQKKCPGKSYLILEARDAIGGTWDLFRYPGIRSDSDMYTFGYSFRPWRTDASIADGSSILAYIKETAEAYGIDRKIRFGYRVKRASWSSGDAVWTIEAERGAGQELVRFTCNFLFTCTGYYDYADGYTPEFPGSEKFGGRIVHPQKWPAEFDYAGQRVVVIGSGATAVTLVPAMAETAAHVTMLQRSPGYVVSLPSKDALANWLRRHLPAKLAYGMVRWRNVLFGVYFYNLCRRKPAQVKRKIIGWARGHLGAGYDVETHFNPRYNPWDQRLCLVPDADLFRAIKAGKAEVVTDRIERFTESGLQLQSGQELAADVIVTATGLKLQLLGGMQVVVDGQPVSFAETMNYKGVMFSDIPNMAAAIGYTNASWTLKCDLTSEYICRLLNYMDKHGYVSCVPRKRDPSITEEPLIDFTSGYIQRSIRELPRQGSKRPWRLRQNYLLDLISLRVSPVRDQAMEFRGGKA
jgi:monooxygenase